jgi:hypothetical protein
MKAIILGGIGTNAKHLLRTTNIYKNKGIKPIFYEADGIFGNNLYRPKKYREKTIDIIRDIEVEKSPYILHCLSGSNWLGYTINSKIPASSIILESSPLEPSIASFQNLIRVNYNMDISRSLVKFGMKTLQIPTDSDSDYHKWYSENKPSHNTLILIGCKDKLIKIDYIKKEYITSNSNNKMILFKKSGHCNISKYEPELYQEVLENFIVKTKHVTF